MNVGTSLVSNPSFLGSQLFLTPLVTWLWFLAWLVYFCSWIAALNSHNVLPHVHWQTNPPGSTASCCFLCLETTLQGSVLRAVLSVVSAPSCRSVDAPSEREEGDMDASGFCGGSQGLEDLCIQMSSEPLFCVV